ncbi:MAG TPA: type II toxin-antitoxin system RelE/ParE family toxin [Phenylobacterium sp.]|nr:type II toxin-antitoxin system RelE/ParE family toxin [Phenylobacterium sp.]
MTTKPVVPSERARRDIRDAVRFYRREAGEEVALGFVDAIRSTLKAIGEHSAAGSPRYAELLDISGLRTWPLPRYPYLVFYAEHESRVEVWRVIHGRRDITTELKRRP